MLETITEVTPEIKRDRRALNAYRHGLTGQVVINTPAEQVAYDTHCAGIHQSLAPVGGMESSLVQSIADDRWRLQRAAAIENSIFAIGIGGEPDQYTAHHEEVDTAFAQATVWLKEGKSIGLLTLYESRLQRRVEKNLALVRQLQQDRRAALQQAVEETATLAQHAINKGESYDAGRDYPREALPPQFDFSTTQIDRLAAHSRGLAEARKHLQQVTKPLRQVA